MNAILPKPMNTAKYPLPLATLLLLILLAACGPIRTVTPAAESTLPAGAVQTNAPLAPGPGNQPTQATAAAAPPAGGADVGLTVVSPQDGAVVNAAQVQVSGTASPGAVVTVNDDILIVGADGTFQSTVALEEGPNLIEVIGSNDAGNQTTVELTVTYEP